MKHVSLLLMLLFVFSTFAEDLELKLRQCYEKNNDLIEELRSLASSQRNYRVIIKQGGYDHQSYSAKRRVRESCSEGRIAQMSCIELKDIDTSGWTPDYIGCAALCITDENSN